MTMDGNLIDTVQGPIRFPDAVSGLLPGSTLNLFDSSSVRDNNNPLAYVFLLLFADNMAKELCRWPIATLTLSLQ